MKARDFDTFMSVVGAFTTLTLIVFKTRLGITTQDCLVGGVVVAGCTKFIAIARLAEILKGGANGNTDTRGYSATGTTIQRSSGL